MWNAKWRDKGTVICSTYIYMNAEKCHKGLHSLRKVFINYYWTFQVLEKLLKLWIIYRKGILSYRKFWFAALDPPQNAYVTYTYVSPYNLTPAIYRVLIGRLFFAYPRDQLAVTRVDNVRQLNIRRDKKLGFQLSHRQPILTHLTLCLKFIRDLLFAGRRIVSEIMCSNVSPRFQ